MYIDNWDERLERYEEYWAQKNHLRPLLSICAPKPGAAYSPKPYTGSMQQRWWDEDFMIENLRGSFGSTYFAGEALPSAWPNLGPDIFAAFLGSEIIYEESTSYSVPSDKSWKDVKISFDENNRYWKKICSMTDRLLNDSNGDYLVGVTDIHQGIDALVSMCGPEKLCMDIYDEPEEVLRVLAEAREAFQIILEKSFKLFEGRQKGVINWMGIYHPQRWYITQADFIYLISPQIFDEFVKEDIRKSAQIIGPNIFHLDGVGSKRHLDKLLEMPEINGVQWVYGAGQPSASHWIDVLKQIQDAGKMIQISCEPEDMQALFQSGLKPEGVQYSLWAKSPDQAQQIIKQAEDAYKTFKIYT